MNIQVVGCSHHKTPIAVRERLAFSPEQTVAAMERWRASYPGVEAVVLSTCNRVEIYLAGDEAAAPKRSRVVDFLAQSHGLDPPTIDRHLFHHCGPDAVEHLFTVSSSLDSMVLGEPQILAQVKQAYQLATEQQMAGPVTHSLFQAAVKVARRVATETAIHQRRVSIPSVAVADFAQQIFERFDDKHTVVVGAGKMAEETLRYLRNEGAHQITVVNRSIERATELAQRWHGRPVAWDQLREALATADLVISTTGAGEPIVTLADFLSIERTRKPGLLFILDLAVPRDFDAAVGQRPDVYLYSIDDLQDACRRNRQQRDKELPAARAIIEQETGCFMAEMNHRATGPIIRRLKQGWQKPKEDELQRLLAKLPELDDRQREEIRRSFDRLLAKLLHPPMASLRDESHNGTPSALVEALSRLFQLKE